MSIEDDHIQSLTSFIKEKGQLTVTSPLSPFSLSIPDKSFSLILSMISESILVNWLNFTITNKAYSSKKSGVRQYDLETCYVNLLSNHEAYYVVPPDTDSLSEEEKVDLIIPVQAPSFRRIMRKAGFDWEEFLNFTLLIHTKNSYSKLKSFQRKKSRISRQYKELFEFIMIYCINFNEKGVIEISRYSMESLLRMAGMDVYDLVDYITLNILTITYEEIVSREARLRYLKQQSSLFALRKDIELNEGSRLYTVRNYGQSKGLKRQSLATFESDALNGGDVMSKNKAVIKRKKEEIELALSLDDAFVEVEDDTKQKVLIRKKLFKEILASTSELDVYEIADYYEKTVKVLKSNLVGINTAEMDYYVLVQYATDNEQSAILLVSVTELKGVYQAWTSYTKKSAEIEDKTTKGKVSLFLAKVKVLPLEDVSLSVQPEELKIINTKKAAIRSGLQRQSKSQYIEYDHNKLILTKLYEKITEHKGAFDEFKVKNQMDGSSIVVSKRKLKSKPKNNYAEYVEVTHSEKSCIVKKAEYEKVLNQWNRMANKVKLMNYSTGQEEDIDLLQTREETLSQHIEDDDLPYQPEEAKETKEKIEKDITEDNEFLFIPSEKVLVRTTLIKELKAMKGSADDAICNVVDSSNVKRKIVKSALMTNALEAYIEIVDTETSSRHYVKRRGLKAVIEDTSKDEAELSDEKGVIIHIKKSRIEVIKQTKIFIGLQVDQIKLRLKQQIKYYYVIVKDINGDCTMIRKEYISLVMNHKPATPFDRYEITNANNATAFISKKSFEEINTETIETFIEIKSKKDSNIHYVSSLTLMKYLKDDYDLGEKEKLQLEAYDITQHKPSYTLKQCKIYIQDIDIVVLSQIELKHQPEEALMKALIDRRQAANEVNAEQDYVLIVNTDNKPIIIRKKMIVEIVRVNKLSQYQRSVFKVINALILKEDRINVASINSNEGDTGDVYTMIIVKGSNKKILVNKNQLRDCLNKAEHPRCLLDCVDYVTKQRVYNTSVISFDYVKGENVSLPIQEEIQLQKTVVASNDLERIVTTTSMNETKSLRPEAAEMPNEEIEVKIKEEEPEMIDLSDNTIEKPKMKPLLQSKQNRTFVVRRAIIRRIHHDN